MGTRRIRPGATLIIIAMTAAVVVVGGSPVTPATADVSEAPGSPPAFADLSVGLARACAVLTDGRVKCWGAGNVGGLGLGDSEARGDAANEMGDDLPAVELGTGRAATAVSAGSNHTCALLDDATVKCWGFGGRLGQGDGVTRGDEPDELGDNLPAIALGTGRTATAVAAGDQMACAVLDNASVKCWGNNTNGELGLGDTNNRGDGPNEMGDNLGVVSLGGGRFARAVTTGGSHACVLLDNASVKCWGDNGSGQLGDSTTNDRGDAPGEMGNTMLAVSLGAGRTATAVSAGTDHTCALLDNGTVKCWGDNANGELGLGDTADRGDFAGEMGDSLPAVDLGMGRTATAVSAGNNTTCATLDNGSVKCWGFNTNGALGLGDNATRGDNAGEMGNNLPAVDLGTGRSASALSTGGTHACALLDDATYKCWGENSDGELGVGDTNDRGNLPGEMGDSLPVVDLGQPRATTSVVVQGTSHACALLVDGAVKCWGRNNAGQLGLGDTVSRGDAPDEMAASLPAIDLGNGRTAVGLAAGNDHTCAILDNAAVKCWGDNLTGQLGLGDTADRGDGPGEMGGNLPTVNLGAGRTAVAIGAGLFHTCAVLDDATLKCWGGNSSGQLGLGDTANRGDQPGEMAGNLPSVDLGGSRTAVAVDSGSLHTCALMDNAKVKCWGDNGNGQLGQGDTLDRGDAGGEMGANLAAVNLGTGRTVVSLTVDNSNCAVLDNGTVKCWGGNSLGRLGLGDIDNRGDGAGEMGDNLPAVDLGTGRTAVAAGVGANHACAVLDDGSVKCWGSSGSGQGGRGDNATRGDGAGEMGDLLTAVDLGTGHIALGLSAGGDSVCAVLETAAIKCWGRNQHGQLGLGDVDARGNGAGEMGNDLPFVQLSGTGDGTISGTVTDSVSAATIPGALVAVMRASDFALIGGATADAGANYAIDVPAGAYFLYLIDAAGTHVEGFAGPPTRVVVRDGNATDADVTMAPRTGSVAGTITRDGGAPAIAGAWALSSSMVNGALERGVVANGAGAYTIPGLSAATHSIIHIDPSGGHAAEYLGGSSSFPGNPIAVTAGATATADGSLATQTSLGGVPAVTGTVTQAGTGTGLSGTWVVALRASDYRFARGTITGAGGTYTLNLVAGAYKLAVVDPSGQHETEWFDNHPATDLGLADSVTAPSAGNNASLTRTTGGFSGTVTQQGSGTPLAGVWVVAINANGALVGARTTDGAGNYAFSTLPVGAYRAAFVDPSGAHALEYWNDSPDYLGGDDIIVTPASNLDADAALEAP